MNSDDILQALRTSFPDIGFEIGAATDQPTIYVPRTEIEPVCRALRDRPDLQFLLLAELTAADYFPRDPRFEIVYHLACLGVPVGPAEAGQHIPEGPAEAGHHNQVMAPQRLRLKVRVPGDDPHVPTLTAVWPNANWLEREVYDLFGVLFDGHPDLRRILMPDDWEGYPLRKDYPVQVGVAVKTYEPLQVTKEEFVATMMRTGRAPMAAPRTRTDDAD